MHFTKIWCHRLCKPKKINGVKWQKLGANLIYVMCSNLSFSYPTSLEKQTKQLNIVFLHFFICNKSAGVRETFWLEQTTKFKQLFWHINLMQKYILWTLWLENNFHNEQWGCTTEGLARLRELIFKINICLVSYDFILVFKNKYYLSLSDANTPS